MSLKIIITGVTGMVGEGVLFECLEQPAVREVLILGRRSYGVSHPKLKECLVPDFMKLEGAEEQLTGYDACFFCAGVSSVGMKEAEYTRITYDTTLNVAQTLVRLNPQMVFTYVSGAYTDSSEKGRLMWARVKGRTENALTRLPFKAVYNFRPGFMKPSRGQKSLKTLYKIITPLYPIVKVLMPGRVCTLKEVGQAMINSVSKGYSRSILEVKDIQTLARA